MSENMKGNKGMNNRITWSKVVILEGHMSLLINNL